MHCFLQRLSKCQRTFPKAFLFDSLQNNKNSCLWPCKMQENRHEHPLDRLVLLRHHTVRAWASTTCMPKKKNMRHKRASRLHYTPPQNLGSLNTPAPSGSMHRKSCNPAETQRFRPRALAASPATNDSAQSSPFCALKPAMLRPARLRRK